MALEVAEASLTSARQISKPELFLRKRAHAESDSVRLWWKNGLSIGHRHGFSIQASTSRIDRESFKQLENSSARNADSILPITKYTTDVDYIVSEHPGRPMLFDKYFFAENTAIDFPFEQNYIEQTVFTLAGEQNDTTQSAETDLLEEVLPNSHLYLDDQWDGWTARAVSERVMHGARDVLNLIKGQFALPDTEAAGDGSICMEWNCGNGLVWVDVNPDATISIFFKQHGQRTERRFQSVGGDLGDFLFSSLKALYDDGAAAATLCVKSI